MGGKLSYEREISPCFEIFEDAGLSKTTVRGANSLFLVTKILRFYLLLKDFFKIFKIFNFFFQDLQNCQVIEILSNCQIAFGISMIISKIFYRLLRDLLFKSFFYSFAPRFRRLRDKPEKKSFFKYRNLSPILTFIQAHFSTLKS